MADEQKGNDEPDHTTTSPTPDEPGKIFGSVSLPNELHPTLTEFAPLTTFPDGRTVVGGTRHPTPKAAKSQAEVDSYYG